MKSLLRHRLEQDTGDEAFCGSSATVWKGQRFSFNLWRHTVVMGILNITPDSFSDGGLHDTPKAALARAWEIAEEGAHVLDVGGESTRPGSDSVPLNEEISRTVPLIAELITSSYPLPISIDTSKPEVAREALQAGAALVNDVTALGSAGMAELVAEHGAGIVLMHMRGTPRDMQLDTAYADVVAEVRNFLADRAGRCISSGIPRESIALDPGIGFGKSVEGNLLLTARLDDIESLGFPVLYGSSRKSFIGKVLDLDVDMRLEGTAATIAAAILCGADIVRVHDVREMARVARMTDAILYALGPQPEE